MRRGKIPWATSLEGCSGIFSSPSCSRWNISIKKRIHEIRTNLILDLAIHRGKVDIVFLNDTGIERVEIHDQDVRIQKPTLGLEYETTLYLSLFPFIVFFVVSGSSSSASILTAAAAFLPHVLSGQIYLSLWNLWSKIYSFRSARPPLRVLFLQITCKLHLDRYRRS